MGTCYLGRVFELVLKFVRKINKISKCFFDFFLRCVCWYFILSLSLSLPPSPPPLSPTPSLFPLSPSPPPPPPPFYLHPTCSMNLYLELFNVKWKYHCYRIFAHQEDDSIGKTNITVSEWQSNLSRCFWELAKFISSRRVEIAFRALQFCLTLSAPSRFSAEKKKFFFR